MDASATGRRPRRLPAGVPFAGRHAAGSASLEFALTTPVLLLVLLVVLHTAVFVRDAVAVQNAAREGARVAATTTVDSAVVAAVRSAMDGRSATVVISPSGRRTGTTVYVDVTYRSKAGPVAIDVRGRAAMRVEPVIGR